MAGEGEDGSQNVVVNGKEEKGGDVGGEGEKGMVNAAVPAAEPMKLDDEVKREVEEKGGSDVNSTLQVGVKEGAPEEEGGEQNGNHQQGEKEQQQKEEKQSGGQKEYTAEELKEMPVRQYLETTVVSNLLQAMQQLVRQRPADPVAWLGDFLSRNHTPVSKKRKEDEVEGQEEEPNEKKAKVHDAA